MSFVADLRAWVLPDRDADSPPVMDGPLTPNRLLDEAQAIGAPLPGCDDLAVLADDSLLITAGNQLLRLSGEGWTQRERVAGFEQKAGAVAVAGAAIHVGLHGAGVVRIENGAVTARLVEVGGAPLRCVTAIAALPDGRVAITEGSSTHGPDEWCADLMKKQTSGRLILASADLTSATILLEYLAWPHGVALAPDGADLWFTESWRHRVQAVPIGGGKPRTLQRNLPGYPARLVSDPGGGAWLSLFAVRTLLVDFVLREDRYRKAMIATVDPRWWIAPSLAATGHYLEPLQGGAIKKLGLVKPWAPPRSYGLVARLSNDGEIVSSLHSRVGGHHHGVTAACPVNGRLLVVSKGAGRVLAAPLETAR